jgi:hypothetical protein
MRNSEDFIEYFIHRRAALSEIISQDALEIVEKNVKLPSKYLYDEDINLDATEARLEYLRVNNKPRYEIEYKKFLQVNKIRLDINEMKKKKREEYNRKLKAVYDSMMKYYGPAVLSKVRLYVETREYFIAWHTLDEYYLRSQISTKRAHIDSIMRASYYDPNKNNLVEFIDKFKVLFDLKEALGTAMGDREKVEELQRAVCAYNTDFYSIINMLVENYADMNLDVFCNMLILHHRKSKMIKLAGERYQQTYKYLSNNNNNSNNQRNQQSNNNNKNGNNGTNINNSNQSSNESNGEAKLTQSRGKKQIRCWDCGK